MTTKSPFKKGGGCHIRAKRRFGTPFEKQLDMNPSAVSSKSNCSLNLETIGIDVPQLFTQLKQCRGPHAAADTHGLHPVFHVVLLHIT